MAYNNHKYINITIQNNVYNEILKTNYTLKKYFFKKKNVYEIEKIIYQKILHCLPRLKGYLCLSLKIPWPISGDISNGANDLHPPKAYIPIILIDNGITISDKELQSSNAQESIKVITGGSSKVTSLSDVHKEKAERPIE